MMKIKQILENTEQIALQNMKKNNLTKEQIAYFQELRFKAMNGLIALEQEKDAFIVYLEFLGIKNV